MCFASKLLSGSVMVSRAFDRAAMCVAYGEEAAMHYGEEAAMHYGEPYPWYWALRNWMIGWSRRAKALR